MLRLAPKLIVVLLVGTALAGCASTANKLAGSDVASANAAKTAAAAKPDKSTPTDLDSGVRQAQMMRYAGQYDDAIRVLSQLMLVASDDPRVVAEYGKTLAQKGRAQDAVQFLNRAIELSSNDWSLYSALGVSYDQLSDHPSAKMAYEHALTLHPEEPSVLNNYALSRMMAGDANGAHALIARAKAAGGATDSKIAANIELLNKVAPQTSVQQDVAAVQKPEAPKPATPATTAPKPLTAPAAASSSAAAPQPSAAQPPVAQAAPHPAAQTAKVATVPSLRAGAVLPPGAQPVPQQVAAKPTDAKPVEAKVAVAKAVEAKPAVAPKPGSPEQAAAIYLALGMSGSGDTKMTKTADAKPADAKPAAKPVRTAAKDEVPALRMTADARSP